MPHIVVQRLDELGPGSRVKIRGQRFTVHVKKIQGDVICGETWNPNDKERRWVEVTLPFSDYEHSLVNSPGFVEPDGLSDAENVWSDCERYYGINHLGQTDPDPARRLAFAILRGDESALAAVRSDMVSMWMKDAGAVKEVLASLS
jgi:hypothetical protein